MSVLEHPEPWHFDELADLPETGERYEVVDGNLVVTPPPSQAHQLAGAVLLEALVAACPPDWRVCYEFPLPLGTDGRVPDLAVVRRDAPTRGSSPYPVGPEHFGLVVEVVSPRSRKTDRFTKPAEYAEAGIPLMWRVELTPALEVLSFALKEGSYQPTEGLLTPWGPIEIDLGVLG